MKEIIRLTENFVKKELEADFSGHDWHHIDRVRKNAKLIWEKEQTGDWFIIEMASLLHDIPDEKMNETEEAGWLKLRSFFVTVEIDQETVNKIEQCIEGVSFKGGRPIELSSPEAAIVQDADRLDALGAIGIARTFAYGGKKGHPIFNPDIAIREQMTIEEYRNGDTSSINHFYEKLLKLKNKMNTVHARELASERHRFMEEFLDQFYSEWNGKA